MDYRQWLREFKAAVAHSNSSELAETLGLLDKLLRRTRRAAKGSVSEWQEGEVLGFRATVVSQGGDYRTAARQYLRLADFYRGHFTQYGHAVASALEIAASTALRAGDRRTAKAVADEVFRLRAQFPDASRSLEDIVRVLREEREAKSRHAATRRRKRQRR